MKQYGNCSQTLKDKLFLPFCILIWVEEYTLDNIVVKRCILLPFNFMQNVKKYNKQKLKVFEQF